MCDIARLPNTETHECIDCEGNTNNRVNATRRYRCLAGYVSQETSTKCLKSGFWNSLERCQRKSSIATTQDKFPFDLLYTLVKSFNLFGFEICWW